MEAANVAFNALKTARDVFNLLKTENHELYSMNEDQQKVINIKQHHSNASKLANNVITQIENIRFKLEKFFQE